MVHNKEKIKIGVSSCLIGEKVRYNGEHKQDRYVLEVLGKFFEYVSANTLSESLEKIFFVRSPASICAIGILL